MTNLLALPIDDENALPDPARLLLYGKPKSRKTWWAGTASKTHRVIFLDGENGTAILSNVPKEQRSRITRIPLGGNTGVPAMARFMALLFKERAFLWDVTLGEQCPVQARYIKEDHHYIEVNLDALTTDDVLVADSWTKLCQDVSMEYAIQNGIDFTSGQIGKTAQSGKDDSMDYFRYMDTVLDRVLSLTNTVPCHMVMIGHEQFYTHQVKEGIVKKEFTRLQLVSSTGKHAAKMPANFGEVFWFKAEGPKTGFPNGLTKIDTSCSEYRDGGGRRVKAGEHVFDDWQWEQYCKEAGIPPAKNPDNQQQAFIGYTGKQILEALGGTKPQPQAGVIQGNS